MNKIKILLVEDDPDYRKSLTAYLRNYVVDSYQNGNEAIAALNRDYNYQAVLLDWALKHEDESGQVLEKVKAINPYLPVIVFTGNPHEGSSAALQRGASWYIRKPFSPEDLETVIQNLLAQDAVSHQMANLAKDITGSDQVLIWRYYEKTRNFILAAWAEPVSIGEKEKTLKENEPKLRRVIRNKSPSFFRDLQHNPSQYHTQIFAKQMKWGLLVSISLRYKGELLGLMEIYSGNERELLSGQHQRIEKRIQTLADQAAESVYNAERASKNQELINSVSSLSAEQPSLDALADAILSKAKKLIDAEAGIFFLRDFGKNSLLALGNENGGLKASSKRIDISNNNLASIAVREGAIESVDGINVSTYAPPFTIGKYRSQVAIPIKRGDLVVGVLVLASKLPYAFSEGDIALMRSFVALASSALDQAKLRLHLQHISQAVLKEPRALQQVVAGAIHELLGKSVALWMWNEEMSAFVVPVALGVSDEFREKARISYVGVDNSLIAHAFLTKQPINLADMENPPEGLTVMLEGLYRRENWRSTLIVPISDSEDQPIGAIAIKRDVVGEFSQYEVDFLSNFASQVAIAFENHLRRDKLAQLVKSGQIAIREITNEKHILQRFVEMASQLTGAPCTVIYPYDPENPTYYDVDRVAAYGRLDMRKTVTHKPRKTGLAQIIRSTKLIVVHDIDKGEIAPIDLSNVPFEYKPLDKKTLINIIIPSSSFISREQIKAFIGISLCVTDVGTAQDEEQEVGVLFINYRTPHHFTQSEIDLIQLFAQQVANLIRAARLLERQQQQLKISQTLVAASNLLANAKDRNEVLRVAFESAFAFIGKTTGFVLSIGRDHRLWIVASRGLTKKQIAKFHSRTDYNKSHFIGVMQTGRIFETDDTRAALTDGRMRDLGLPIQIEVTNLPLFSGEKVSGILVLDTFITNPKIKDALFALTDIVSTALSKVDTFEEQGYQLDAFKDIADVIGSSRNPLAVVLERAVKLFNADYGNIGLSIPAARELVFNVHWENGKCLIDEEIPSDKRFSSWDHGVPGYVARVGEVRCEADLSKCSDYMMWYSDSRSELTVPLIGSKGDVIGVLNLESKVAGNFGEAEADLCKRFASMAAVTIEISDLLANTEEMNRQLETLHDIVQQRDMAEALRQVALGVNRFMGAKTCTCTITLFDEQENRFSSDVVAVGPLAEKVRISPRVAGMGWYALDHRTPLFLENVDHSGSGIPELHPDFLNAGIHSIVVLPLIIHGEHKLGVLYLYRQQSSVFSPELRNLLTIYADQAALAIENARQYEQRGRHIAALQEAYEQLNILHSVAQEKDLSVNLRQIVLGINKVMGEETCACSLTLFDEKEDRFFSTVETVGALADKMRIAPHEQGKENVGWGRYALDRQKSMFIEDTNRLPSGIPKMNPGLTQAGVRSFVALPLIRNEHKLGVIFIYQQRPVIFSPDLRQLLETYAHQAAIAIENARRYEQRSEDIAALRSINEAVVASRGLDEILSLIVTKAVDVMPAEYGSLWLEDSVSRDSASRDLVLRASYSQSGDVLHPHPDRLMADAPSVEMRTFQTGESAILNDVTRNESEFHRIYLQARSELAVPMKYQGKTIGTLNVESRFPDAFSGENAKLLESFADQAAIALHNAQLVSRLRVATGVSRELLHRLWREEEDIFKYIKDEAGRFMDMENFYIALYFERNREVSFPFVYVDGHRIDTTASDSLWKPRYDGKGLTEEIVRNKKYLLMKTRREQEQWYKERGINYVNISFASWLGVPLLQSEQAIGVIATYHTTSEYKYGEDDIQILSLLASPLAIALKNIREVNILQTLNHELLQLSASYLEQETGSLVEKKQ
ncbi:MAG: GAF domain-containing protein [Chloroflexota bacterium]